MRGAVLVAALAPGPACAPDPGTERAPNPLESPPVDSARLGSAVEAARWPLRRTVAADLDGDGRDESVVLSADVTLASDGDALWEDGHRWAVWVDDPDTPTLLYAAFVPMGHVTAAIGVEGDDGTRHVLVDERTPGQSRVLQIAYAGPGQARLVSAAHAAIERWLPDLRGVTPSASAAPSPSPASPRAPRDSAASRP